MNSHVSSLEVIQRNHPKERMVSMVNIIKQEIVIEESLKKKKEKFLNLEEFLFYSIKKKLINH